MLTIYSSLYYDFVALLLSNCIRIQIVKNLTHNNLCLFFVTVLDKKHFWPQRKIHFKLPKMATSRPTKIPILHKSIGSKHDHDSSTPSKNINDEQQASQAVDSLKKSIMLETNELSNSLHINGGRSADSSFVDEKTRATVKVANESDDSSHIEAKLFMPLEEAITGSSQGSLVSTESSTSLEEMVGDECSSSGYECVQMSKASQSPDHAISPELHRPRSACDNYIANCLPSDQKMKKYDSLPQLESSPTLLASKIDLLHSKKVCAAK